MVQSKSGLSKIVQITKFILLLTVLFAFIAPFFLVIINSFKTKREIIENPLRLFEPGGPIFENYTNAWESMEFPKAFCNSLIITLASVLFIILFSSMAAYLFARTNWKINKVIFALMLAGMAVPFQSLMIPLVSIYGAQLNILNSRATMVFMYNGFGVGMAIFIYHGFIKTNIPVSLEEAAFLEGCSKLQTFFKVVLPLLKPISATLVVLDVLWIWNDYLLPSLVLGEKSLFTLPLSTYAFYDTYTVDYGGIMASLVLTILPIMLLYIFLQKQIIGGVLSGAVKS